MLKLKPWAKAIPKAGLASVVNTDLPRTAYYSPGGKRQTVQNGYHVINIVFYVFLQLDPLKFI